MDKLNSNGGYRPDGPSLDVMEIVLPSSGTAARPVPSQKITAEKCCATCHFGVDGDGDTIHCNWTGNKRMPRDGVCESYDGEHPDVEYWRKDSEAKDAENTELRAEVERLPARIAAWLRSTPTACGVLISIISAQDIARLADDIERGMFRAALAEKE